MAEIEAFKLSDPTADDQPTRDPARSIVLILARPRRTWTIPYVHSWSSNRSFEDTTQARPRRLTRRQPPPRPIRADSDPAGRSRCSSRTSDGAAVARAIRIVNEKRGTAQRLSHHDHSSARPVARATTIERSDRCQLAAALILADDTRCRHSRFDLSSPNDDTQRAMPSSCDRTRARESCTDGRNGHGRHSTTQTKQRRFSAAPLT